MNHREMLCQILTAQSADEVEKNRQSAEQALLCHRGDTVALRGLIEFSNRCTADCFYCGIRRSNRALGRYTLNLDEIITSACWSAAQGYGSVVLQSGERNDPRFIRFISDALREIKAATRSERLPQGVGITLSVGEQSPDTYAEWLAAGAHRYLLRMESSSPTLFAALHPPTQSYEKRVHCLRMLKSIGYIVGTGVMIGLPGQTVQHLVDDILFFRDIGADMIGMGPYIPHPQAVLPQAVPDATTRVDLSLRMIAATRILLPTINIAATTALQTLVPDGLVQGLRHGANVVMPQATPQRVRQQYTLYAGKVCLDDSAAQVSAQIHAAGRRVLCDDWGDRETTTTITCAL